MKIKRLEEVLLELATKDLAEGANIYDHPCSVAIRAIDDAFFAGYSLGYDISANIDSKGELLEYFKSVKDV